MSRVNKAQSTGEMLLLQNAASEAGMKTSGFTLGVCLTGPNDDSVLGVGCPPTHLVSWVGVIFFAVVSFLARATGHSPIRWPNTLQNLHPMKGHSSSK